MVVVEEVELFVVDIEEDVDEDELVDIEELLV